jgi:hypothetical protein
VIDKDFAFHGNKAANRLRNLHDHGTARGAVGTNRTKQAGAGPGVGAPGSIPTAGRPAAPRGAPGNVTKRGCRAWCRGWLVSMGRIKRAKWASRLERRGMQWPVPESISPDGVVGRLGRNLPAR